MSILFGIARPEGQIVAEDELRELESVTAHHADGVYRRVAHRIGMGFQPYHTHLRSHLESTPVIDRLGNVMTWDGRLDNGKVLSDLLGLCFDESSDSAIVLAAFRKWDEGCFARLIGDWALALWCCRHQALYLARDHAGTRTLFYELRDGAIIWSTYLDTLCGRQDSKPLDETYVAAYLSCQPIGDRTPYPNVTAVPPAHFLRFCRGQMRRKPHWEWIAKDEIRYQRNDDYEDHFRAAFRTAVERRTGPGAPIVAELSGGMDSSSIVCMSDHIRRAAGHSHKDLLDTVSYFDESEPHWDERPYFNAVEAARGKRGLHIDLSEARPSFQPFPRAAMRVPALPGADARLVAEELRLNRELDSRGYRAVISGIGGDEFLGGVPSGLPELSDLLYRGRLAALAHSTTQWCLAQRLPFLQMLWQTCVFAASSYRPLRTDAKRLPAWTGGRVREAVSRGEFKGVHSSWWSGTLPSRASNGLTWWLVLETLPNPHLRSATRREYRFPYLDRDLVDFLLRIPNEQLVRPGRRRDLMRRALKEIVPEQILERRRKAFVARAPATTLERGMSTIHALMAESEAQRRGYIKGGVLLDHLRSQPLDSSDPWRLPAIRTVLFELWLRANHATDCPV